MLISTRVPIHGQGVKDKCAALNYVFLILEGHLFAYTAAWFPVVLLRLRLILEFQGVPR